MKGRQALRSRILSEDSQCPRISSIVFDLDQTLYWSQAFNTATSRLARLCVKEQLGTSDDMAGEMLRNHRTLLMATLGFTPALSTTLVNLGISLDTWGGYQGRVDVEGLIIPDPQVRLIIQSLQARFGLFLYTNMCRPLALATLSHIGLSNCFQMVITPQDTHSTKPDSRTYLELERTGYLRISETLSVGDRYEIDVAPACELGGWGFMVENCQSLIALQRLLLGESPRDGIKR